MFAASAMEEAVANAVSQPLSADNLATLLQNTDAFLFDCDGKIILPLFSSRPSTSDVKNGVFLILATCCRLSGVIWKGDKLIDGVAETLDVLRSMVL